MRFITLIQRLSTIENPSLYLEFCSYEPMKTTEQTSIIDKSSNYHNDSSTIPVVFIVNILSTSTEIIFAGTMKKRESERLQRFDLELDAILISVFKPLVSRSQTHPTASEGKGLVKACSATCPLHQEFDAPIKDQHVIVTHAICGIASKNKWRKLLLMLENA